MERERLARIAKVALRHSENPDLGLAAEIVDLEDRLAEKVEEAVSLANEVAKMEGPKGEPGEDGADADEEEIIERVIPAVIAAIPIPENGKDGRDGRDGKDGRDGIDGKDGVDGVDGKDGEPGTPGRDGSPDTGEQIVEKVNKSKGKRISAERLDLDDIRSGIAQVAAINRGPGGSTGLEKVTGPSFSRQGVSELSFSGSTVTVSRTGNGVNVDIGGGVDTDEKAKVSANDTTAGYLNGKLVAGTGISLTENNNGGNETLTIASTLDLSGYVPYTGATGDVNLGTHALIAHAVKGDASDGLLVEANNGTDIGILGAGNTANVTWYGSHNFDTATQDTVAAFIGAGKTLSSLATATYPSLTEFSYVKGVTSAIQTQLDAKEAALTFSTGLARAANTVTANLSTGVSGGQSVIGGTASGDDLTLSSTAHATKGTINFGTSGSSAYTESTRSLLIGNTGSVNYYADDGRIDIVRGGARITSGFGGYYPNLVISSTTGGNSDVSIALVGRTVSPGLGTQSIVFGNYDDPDEAAIVYDPGNNSFKYYIGGNTNPDFTMEGGSNIRFGWGYQGTPPTSSKFFLGKAGQGDVKYVEFQSGAYGLWAQKIGWDVTSNGSGNGKGYLSLSNVVGNTNNVGVLKINEERFGFNTSEKFNSFDIVAAADDVSEGTTAANASTTINGSSTIFKKQIAVGDRISLSSASSTYATVTAIASDTSLTVDAALGNGTSQTINIKHGMFRVSSSSGAQKVLVDDEGNLSVGYDRSNLMKVSVSSSGAATFDAVGSGASFTFSDDVILADGKNVQANATTGSKIGTATTQKLGFWNAAPIAQPASANQAALSLDTDVTGIDLVDKAAVDANFAAIQTLVNQLRADLVAAGLIKGSA